MKPFPTPELDLTILIPLYNEEESLGELHEWLTRVLTPHGRELRNPLDRRRQH